ncbi:protein-disulfide reductase DsbD family protein [Methylobacterium platani]|uniref:Thiol:disulfide interchange protein n=2 Tax=Methylobacterium platani TaxID=427683 RepID=A0A179SIL5_9HYPH|nr:protein-disulfide reductase DsbD domain-containing protein [Methylobacterium platani]KMO14122.1 thiol:disulfide interchange protein [Methylobacterium platani JCM 14648]OAS26840.1 thiol:disulfide interchange protein [Methylobacterium platani]
MPARRLARLLVPLLALWGAGPVAAQAPRPSKYADLVRAELVTEESAVAPGATLTAGVRLTMKPGWHVYWRNPGDSGLPPEIAWSLPAGFSAGAVAWPAPERIPVGDLMNFGYEDEVLLTVPVAVPATLGPGPVSLRAKVSYLVCERECVPGEASLATSLPVAPAGTSPRPDPRAAALFAQERARLPVPAPWPVRLRQESGTPVLDIAAPGLKARDVAFFPYSETALEHAAAQVATSDGAGLHLRLQRSSQAAADAPAPGADGVLTLTEDTESGPVRRAYALGDAAPPAPAAASPAVTTPVAAPAATGEAEGLWHAALLAFLGGLLLNLMPCVFPVLSIKVLSLVRHSGESPARVRLHGLAYAAGVLATFLGLAGLLIALRAGGAQIGWGFQLQSPLVVAGLAYGLLAMGLSLSGVWHLGGRAAGLGDGLARRAGLEGSFFTGVLATVVATPCTAPFMGAAVGYGLTQGAAVALTVFAALGLGLALPFALLAAWPAGLRRLPRPGAWMETLKGILAFPLYLTVAWLVWVLSQQVGPTGLMAGLTGLVLVGFCAWTIERGRMAGPLARRSAQAAVLLGLVGLAGLLVALDRDRAGPVAVAAADGIEPFSRARLDALLAEHRPVFVNMTAAWCITCQVNDRATLRAAAVREAFKAHDIAQLKGDWTNQNPEITRVLEANGRSGVPLYLLYDGRGGVAVLPQILTEATVRDALAALPAGTGPRAALR